ncbi:outer membrane protein [Propylenella binzhouense]|nr:outer membrane protein [Propylenella binzhouense]
MEPVAPAPVTSVALFSWTGAYVGANVGYGWGRDDTVGIRSAAGSFGNIGKFDPQGWLAGVQAGYNYQMDNFVFGLEGDVQWTNIDDDKGLRVSTGGPAGAVTASGKTDLDWYATIRARAGVAFDQFLLYGTGGLAFGDVNYRVNVTSAPAANISDSDTTWGWVLGAGVEYAFTQNLSAKAEYQYLDFGTDDISGGIYKTTPSSQYHTFRVGLNYRFSGL